MPEYIYVRHLCQGTITTGACTFYHSLVFLSFTLSVELYRHLFLG